MRRIACGIFLAALLLKVLPVAASSSYMSDDELKTQAREALGQILDLWRDGNFAELYGVSTGGTHTRENFSRRLAAASLKPACCWQKMQEVTVRLQTDTKATVKARFGFEGRGGSEYKTRSLKLEKEDGVWRISRADILSMAEAPKKKKERHRVYRKY